MISHFLSKQFLAFIFVGITASILHWLFRYGLNFWVPFEFAVVIAYTFSLGSGFILNRLFVFPNSNRAINLQMRDFILTHLGFFPVVWGLSLILVILLPKIGVTIYVEGIAHALAIGFPMFATFLIYKFLAFRVEAK